MVIFTRTYDFVSWLIPLSLKFPRSQRFVVTQRLQHAALDFQELLIEANARRGALRFEKLKQADTALTKLKLYLRLCQRWQWLSNGQHQHGVVMLSEMGKLLGGWLKTVTSSA
jgi:hypothetical protein